MPADVIKAMDEAIPQQYQTMVIRSLRPELPDEHGHLELHAIITEEKVSQVEEKVRHYIIIYA